MTSQHTQLEDILAEHCNVPLLNRQESSGFRRACVDDYRTLVYAGDLSRDLELCQQAAEFFSGRGIAALAQRANLRAKACRVVMNETAIHL